MANSGERGEWSSTNIPASWAWISFHDAYADHTSSDKKLPQNLYLSEGRFPVIDQGQDQVGGFTDDGSLVYDGPLPAVVFGDHTRCVKLVEMPFAQGADGVKVLSATAIIDARFAYQALRAIRLPDKGYSRHFKFLRASSFPLPPLNEQRRIVAKLEALLARSRRAKEALDAVPALLERFRQSVLASAFRGDLTKDWREKNPNVEPASKLLERIRVERRRRWEEAELQKMKAKGKVPKDDKWKQKYEEPEDAIVGAGLSPLPDSWCWSSAADIVAPNADIIYGIVQPGPEVTNGVPYVRGMDIENGRILVEQLKRTSVEIAKRYDRATLRGGDVLLGIIRATKVAIVPDTLEGGNITQGTARLRPADGIATGFLATYLESQAAQDRLHAMYRGIDMPGLNLRDVRRLPVVLAPHAEQVELCHRLEASRAVEARLRSVWERAAQAAGTMDQALLAKAFRGELVQQDSSDEPASLLLERIKAEREAPRADAAQPAPKRSRRSKRS